MKAIFGYEPLDSVNFYKWTSKDDSPIDAIRQRIAHTERIENLKG